MKTAHETFADLEFQMGLLKEIQVKAENLKKELLQKMKEEGLRKLTGERFIATKINESTTVTFDSTRFRKEHPEMEDEYTKTSKRKEHLKVEENKEEKKLNAEVDRAARQMMDLTKGISDES